MQNKLYKPFFNATNEVFQLMLDMQITEEVASGKAVYTDDRVNIGIELTGDIKGCVIYSFPCDTSLEIVKIMSGMEMTEIDEFVTSAMGEIANIISGNVATLLTDESINCDIMPPEILFGEGLKTLLSKYDDSLGMHIKTQIGNITIEILLEAVKNV